MYPFSIKINKFRSIEGGAEIPLNAKTTFIVGPNNSGKSNILRSLAAIFNFKLDDENEYDFNFNIININYIKKELNHHQRSAILDGNYEFKLSKTGITPVNIYPRELNDYIARESFEKDFRSSVNSHTFEKNIKIFHEFIFEEVTRLIKGTVYVPTTRFITPKGTEPEHFSKIEMPGVTISYGKIIERLAEMDRPSANREVMRQQFKELEHFISFCLEKPDTTIQIPSDKSTILVAIDGTERPINELGTGVEQLVIIGLASFGFPGKMVLIDEPELHFHPRAQKRMIQYLNDNVDAHFVFATHSAAILDSVDADVLQVSHDGQKSTVRTLKSNNEKYEAVRDLGHSPSDLLLTRFAIWVEGPSDRTYLNHWIKKLDPDLLEGIDYTILFYGGSVLSHHGFDEEGEDLVKAVSLSRAFAVVMDSDIKTSGDKINATKERVRQEVEKQNGICWITDGREVENYLPIDVIKALQPKFSGATIPASNFDQVLNPDKVKKTEFAKAAVEIETEEWPLDLKKRVTQLVDAINKAR